MDSFFDYIILLFFIISMLSSLFKQKKKPPVDTGGDFDYYDDEEKHSPVDVNSKTGEMQNYSRLEYDIKKASEASETAKPKMEDKYGELMRNRKFDGVTESITREEEGAKTITVNIRAKNLSDKLRNPESFKDYFIVSELLNKPLGLRDDGY